MPYVAESLIVLQHEKLVAMIYPDFDDAFAHGLQQTDIQKVMEQNRIELNQQLPNYSQISKIKIHFEEFEKTAKKSIKTLYVSGSKGIIIPDSAISILAISEKQYNSKRRNT